MHVFFDLDGTLTNPREGIIRCLKHALNTLGYPSPADDQLERYIGPPLRETFASLLNAGDAGLIERAVALYRERFATSGMFENSVYPGIENAMATLQARNVELFVTTGKPRVFALQILEHFNLERFFHRTYGSELDGTRSDKGELLAHVLATESISGKSVIMVGDREDDIKGALTNGVTPVGAMWGFGSRQELTRAGATLLCESPGALAEVLLSQSTLEQDAHPLGATQR